MQVAIDSDLPILSTVAEDGTFISDVQPWAGKFVKDADPYIIRDLADRGLLFKKEEYVHTYPFCWRCDTPLLYYGASDLVYSHQSIQRPHGGIEQSDQLVSGSYQGRAVWQLAIK